MNIPYSEKYTINMYDSDPIQFQLTENGDPVSEDLTGQEIMFFIRNHDVNWQNIEKNVADEGWVVDNVNKIFKVVIDTTAYLMNNYPLRETITYRVRVEWVDRKLILADFDLDVIPVDLWSSEC